MKMKGKLALLGSLLFAAGCLAGCGEEDGNKIKVTFWHTMGAENRTMLDKMIGEFNKTYPDVVIEHASQGDYNDLRTKTDSSIVAGTNPTMAFCYPDHVAEYAAKGAVIDVTDYINSGTLGFTSDDGAVEDYVAEYWREGSEYDTEGVFSVPYAKSTEVMFYNKDFFTANSISVPTTWTEMEAVMAQCKEVDPNCTPLGYDSDDNIFITLCEQMHIPYTSNTNVTLAKDHFLFNNQKAKDMVSMVKGWYDNGYIITSGTDEEGSYTSTRFTEGKCYMTIGSTGGTRYNFTEDFNVGVAPIPGMTDRDFEVDGQTVKGKNSCISQGPSICFFSRATDAQKEAAWNFYKFITRTENTAAYSVSTGYNPVRQSSLTGETMSKFITNNKGVASKNGLIAETLEMNNALFSRYFVSPAFKGSATARQEVSYILSNVLTGVKSINDAFADAFGNCVFAA